MATGSVFHGREGILYNSTGGDSDDLGTEIGYIESFDIEFSRDVSEITKINTSAKEKVEGLVDFTLVSNGYFRIGDTAGLDKLIGRFAKVQRSGDTAAAAITDGTLYAHCVLKPIDTAASTGVRAGAKFICPILSNGFGVSVNGGENTGWSYNGEGNGAATYIVSTSTGDGLPKKAY